MSNYTASQGNISFYIVNKNLTHQPWYAACRKHVVTAVLLCVVLFPVSAAANLSGKPLIDSLVKELAAYGSGRDSAKIKLLNRIATSSSFINPDDV